MRTMGKSMWPDFAALYAQWENQKHCRYLSDCPHRAEYLIKEQIHAQKELYHSNWVCEEHRKVMIEGIGNRRSFSVTYYKEEENRDLVDQ